MIDAFKWTVFTPGGGLYIHLCNITLLEIFVNSIWGIRGN